MEGQLDQLVFHHIPAGHHHQDEASRLCHENLKPLHRGRSLPGRHSVGRQIRGLGDQSGYLVQDLVKLLHFQLHGVFQVLGLIHAELVALHQLIHIQPVSCRGGNPPGGGVGLLQKAHGGEVRQLIANGGGGVVHAGHGRNGLGAHRLCGANIEVHHRLQDLFLPLSQFHDVSSC